MFVPRGRFVAGVGAVAAEFRFGVPCCWCTHYTELLAISDDLARSFYEQQCMQEDMHENSSSTGESDRGLFCGG